MICETVLSCPRRNQSVYGFSLAELMVSIALIAVLAGALGVGMFRSHSRTDEIRTSLSQQQIKKDVLRGLAEDLRWATQIQQLDAQNISFITPDPLAGGASAVIAYAWDDIDYTLSRTFNSDNPVIVAQDVQVFTLDSDTFVQGADTYVQALTVTIQIGPDSNDQLQQYIGLVNTPAL